MAGGSGLLGAGALLLRGVGATSGFGGVWWPFAVIGVGYGLLSTPMAATVLGAVPPERAGMGSSTNRTARLVGGVFGIAVLGACLPAGHGAGREATRFTAGLHTALLIAGAVALCGACLAVALLRGNRTARP